MSKLLYIQASPLKERSYSIRVADAFVDAYRESRPGDGVETLNVFEADLPPFDGAVVQAKYRILHGREHTREEADAWKAVVKVIDQFTAADKYVLAVPMWNFGIPYRLKQYLDIIVQPGLTFSFSPEEGYKGLVTGKPALVVYARGGEYPEGSDTKPMDLQKRYMEVILGFIGFTDVRPIVVEPTMMGGPETAERRTEEAVKKAREIAAGF